MKKSEKAKKETLEEIASLVRENEHMLPIQEEDIKKLHGEIYITGTEERITRIGDMDVDAYYDKDLEEFYYTYEDLPLETLEEIKTVLENAKIDFDKTMKRCEN